MPSHRCVFNAWRSTSSWNPKSPLALVVLETTMPPKRLGMTIKRLRERRGLTQAALAKRAGVHRVYLAQIETQTKVTSIATLEKIAKALNVKVGRLLE